MAAEKSPASRNGTGYFVLAWEFCGMFFPYKVGCLVQGSKIFRGHICPGMVCHVPL